jgi:hypothetical protein
MRRKPPGTSPLRRKVTPQERADTERMLVEWLRDKPHAPAGATAREKVVRDLFDVIKEGPLIDLPEPGPEQ